MFDPTSNDSSVRAAANSHPGDGSSSFSCGDPPPETALARRQDPPSPVPLDSPKALTPLAVDELERELFPAPPEPRPLLPARLIDPLVLILAMATLIPEQGWTGLVLTTLGLGQEQMLILLGSPIGLGGALAVGPYWLWRAGAWGHALEKAFWRRDLNHKLWFLLPYFVMPVGVLAALLVGRLLWDRVPLEEAGRSHARLLRLGWAAAVFGSIALLTNNPVAWRMF